VSALVAIARKEFRHILRDPWMLVFSTLGTVVLMIAMGFALSANIKDIPIAIADGDHTRQSRDYVQRFANDDFLAIGTWAPNEQAAREDVRLGRAVGAIIIPAGFSGSLQKGQQATVQIIVDGTEPEIALQLVASAEALSAGYSVALLQERLASAGIATSSGAMPLEIRPRILYDPRLKASNNLLPALMSIVLAFPALAAALSLVREGEEGSLESLLSTPMRRYHLLIGKGVPYFIIGTLDIVFLTWVCVALFRVPFRGRLADLVVLSGLFLFANLGVGILLSSVLRTQTAVLIIGALVFVMPLTQSGFTTPLYTLSPDAQLQALLWPATHYVIIARAVFLKGVGVQGLMTHGIYLLFAGLALNGLAVWRTKSKLA